MNTMIELITTQSVKDAEGFANTGESIIATVRAYKEDRHGNESWKNRAVFTSASALFRFRRLPGISVKTNMVIVCDTGRYNIVSVEDVKNRGMYIEVLCERMDTNG
ncbi:Uncharacterised protein [Acetobacterium wieringae]|nr:Uncharacterised protein [Acetobacterium wieringae]